MRFGAGFRGQQRIKVFVWLLAKEKLLCNEERVRRHLSSCARCETCGAASESIYHIFRGCPIAVAVWNGLIKRDKWVEFMCLDTMEWIRGNLASNSSFAIDSVDWDLRFGAILWSLWLRRNAMIFDPDNIDMLAVSDRSLWLWKEMQSACALDGLARPNHESRADSLLSSRGSLRSSRAVAREKNQCEHTKMGCQMLCLLLTLTLMSTTSIVQGCHPADLKGLAGFRGGIHMDTSGRLAKWAGLSCCTWQGVACNNRTGRVTQVHLPGFVSTADFVFQSQMEGWLSPSITLLTSLEVLDLGGLVGLSGRIPKSIGHLKNLKKLYLYGNKLRGPVPDSIGKLSKLEELHLHENRLSGYLPPGVGCLKNLNALLLHSNRFTGSIPSSFSNLTNLTYLDLHSNSLTGNIPENIGELQVLKELDLSENFLTGKIPVSATKQSSGKIPPNFGYLVSLQRVSLENNKLEGAIPSSFGNLQALSELYLGGNELSGVIPKSIGQLSRLILLSLSRNLIQGPLPDEMSALQNLQTLDLSFNSLNLSSIPRWVAELPSLSRIFLAECGIEGRIPDLLRSTASPIQELDLSANYLTGGIPAWMGSLTQLYSLNLSRNHLSSSIPASFADFEVLGVLDLNSNNLTGSLEHVFKIGTSFPGGSLTYIDLSDNSFTSGIEQIGVGTLERLEYLNLSHNLQEGQLPTSVAKLKALKCLDLSCNKLGFGLVEALANLSNLETLKLQRNHFTGKIPVEYLKLKNLKDLDLSDNLLVGEIPAGKPLSDFPQSCFTGNRGLCGKPLSPCKS
ncbi:hypothetical protein V6N11_030791 [Hibiscus sabdariffa]|uniref:Leucine-rich repeat-containing N-terminal plant-type domain-containing protein n=1 Tax=Hibiscus sabdariffa TaxID=183260 RepID=A0ABR2AH32_9ROSI